MSLKNPEPKVRVLLSRVLPPEVSSGSKGRGPLPLNRYGVSPPPSRGRRNNMFINEHNSNINNNINNNNNNSNNNNNDNNDNNRP